MLNNMEVSKLAGTKNTGAQKHVRQHETINI